MKAHFTVVQWDQRGAGRTLGDLPQLAILLSRAVKAIEFAVFPERVYICMFGESASALFIFTSLRECTG
jgi:hypothetical protein